MALVSEDKINKLYGKDIDLKAVSGAVDGTQYTTLVPGETVELTDKRYPAGNFICREIEKPINGVLRTVQTIGWMTPAGRFLALGSMFKRNAEGKMNPKNTGFPADTVEKLDLVQKLIGATVKIGEREEIDVLVFGTTDTKKGSWHSFECKLKA